jgi:hypothetical protein
LVVGLFVCSGVGLLVGEGVKRSGINWLDTKTEAPATKMHNKKTLPKAILFTSNTKYS